MPKGYESFIKEIKGMEMYDPEKHELIMLKAIYGLKDAPRAWRRPLHAALLQLNGRQMKSENALYMWHDPKTGELVMIVSTHVDDLKITGTTHYIDLLLREMTKLLGSLKVKYGTFEHWYSICSTKGHVYSLPSKPLL